MYERILQLLTQRRNHATDLRSRPHDHTDWGRTVEVLEERVVLTTTSFPHTVSASPGPFAPQHDLTFESVSGDPNNDGVITNGDRTPDWVVTLQVPSFPDPTSPPHSYRLDLLQGSTVIASSGNRAAGTSTLQLAVTGNVNELNFGETAITARLYNDPDTAVESFFDFTDAVTVKVNRPPQANGGTFSTDEDTSRTLTFGDLGVTDPDFDNVTLEFVGMSTGTGTFLLQGGATEILYTPDDDANGSGIASIDFLARDQFGAVSPTRTITIDVTPQPDDPRVQTPIPDVNVGEDAPDEVINLDNHFVEVDGEALVYSVTSNTNPSLLGTLFTGSMLTLDFQNNQSGGAMITVRATDDSMQFVEDTFEVTVNSVLDPPVILGFNDNIEQDTGTFGDGDLTNDNRPVIFGGAEQGAEMTLRLNDANGPSIGPSQLVGASQQFSIQTNVDLADGTNQIVAVATRGVETTVSLPFTIEVDTSIAIPTFSSIEDDTGVSAADQITSDSTPTFRGTVDGNDPSPPVTVSVADENGTIIASAVDVTGMTDYSLPLTGAPLAEGTHSLTATATDNAGNEQSVIIDVFVDVTDPVVSDPELMSSTIPGGLSTNATSDQTPNVRVTVSERRFSGTDHTLSSVRLIERLSDGTEVLLHERTDVLIPLGPDGVVDVTVDLESEQELTAGSHTLFVRVTDAAGNQADSDDLSVSVFIPQPPTLEAPATPVFADIFDLRTIGTHPEGTGSDVFFEDGTKVDFRGAHVWQMSFDKSTQTVWVNLEHGLNNTPDEMTLDNSRFGTMQFDPATGQFRLFDYRTIFGEDAVIVNNETDSGGMIVSSDDENGGGTDGLTDFRNPHGNFFDINTHVNPRIWIAHRNPVGGTGAGQIGGDGRLSYIEVRANPGGQHRVVSYDIAEIARDHDMNLELTDFHAAFVDTRGTVWVTASDQSAILEIDFDVEPDPSDPDGFLPSATIDSTSARVKVHEIPAGTLTDEDPSEEHTEFHGHALKVVVDDHTGEQYVWMASVGSVESGAKGQVALLRPGAGADGENVWTTWDIPMGSVDAQRARVPFVDIDDNESPGDPSDDRIIFVAPVPLGEGVPTGETIGIVQVFEPGIVPQAPTAETDGRLRTYQIDGLTTDFAATNQPFVDREGGIYWIDRLSGVGRIDPDQATAIVDDDTVTARHLTNPVHDAFFINPTEGDLTTPVVGYAAIDVSGVFQDQSTNVGVDQYAVKGGNASMGRGGIGLGPFRGALNASNVLYGSHSKQDEISVSVFAETPRRQMSVVRLTPDEQIPNGVRVEDRMAFQTIRTTDQNGDETGAVLMTFRENGQILDHQINLTRLLAEQTGKSVEELGFHSDPSAIVANGQVHVIGTAKDGLNINRYRFNLATRTWSHDSFGAPASGVLAGEPQALLTGDGNLVVVVTNSLLNGDQIEGHLLANTFDANGNHLQTVDLTNQPGVPAGSFVYGNPGHIVDGSTIFLYGADQTGRVIEYVVDTTAGISVSADYIDTGGPVTRETRILQNIYAEEIAGERHLFGFDGTSRLVHYRITADASGGTPPQAVAESVTILAQANSPTGYFADFQAGFEARAYPEIAVLVDPLDASLHVYGTNGGDLIEFINDESGWTAHNLTNDAAPGFGRRVSANSVFGAPDAYIGVDGNRHVLQTNAEGEVVEYVFDRTLQSFNERTGEYVTLPRYTTRNINLTTGIEVQDLRRIDLPTRIGIGGGPVLGEVNSDPVRIAPSAFLTSGDASLDGIILSVRLADGVPGDLLSIPNLGMGIGQIGTAGAMVTYEGTDIGTQFFEGPQVPDRLVVELNANADVPSMEALLQALSFSTTGEFGLRTVEISLLTPSGEPIGDRVATAIGVAPVGTLDGPIVPVMGVV